MASKQSTADFIEDQLASLEGISTRKMFGEYAVYYGGKVVGLICDNTLYIKITEPGKKFVSDGYKEGAAYPGAKASMVIDNEQIEDGDWLCELVRMTAEALPAPKPKK
jgi:TfoX/Sxy family transcriptional regulator of competence genes